MWKYIFNNNITSSKSGFEFKMLNSYDKRKAEADRIKSKFPDKIPVIVEKGDSSTLPSVVKQKFLIPKDVTIGQFLYLIRTNIQLDPSEAIFLMINGTIIPSTIDTVGSVYLKHADKDGFLYVNYCQNQVFG